jgi:hypothetical protein
MLGKSVLLTLSLLLPMMAWGYPPGCSLTDTVVIVDNDVRPIAEGGPEVLHLTSNNLYVLVGHVYVDIGCKIIIDPGTVIWGTNPNDPVYAPDTNNPGALIIAQGGLIDAQGTMNDPIIFTCVNDNVCDPDDFGYNDRGLWGGVIILGYAQINTDEGVGHIEGIPEGESRADYGGENDADSSGVLRYVSVRHGGHTIAADNEINGFTFGAVGSKTVMDHLEVFSNADDGYEWFGGDVNVRHFVAAYNDDDCFDFDEGIRGTFQFLFAIYTHDVGDKNGEHDGGTTPEDGTPYANPTLYNATYIGRGTVAHGGVNNGKSSSFHIRDNFGGHYKNSLFLEAAAWGIYEIENLDAGYANPNLVDSEQRLRMGDLTFEHCMWDGHGTDYNVGYINTVPDGQGYHHVIAYFADTSYDGSAGYYSNHTGPTNDFGIDPLLVSLNWNDGPHGLLDPRLQATSPAVGGSMASYDPGFTPVNYKGAFPPVGTKDFPYPDPCDDWMAYWTYLYQKNILPAQAPYYPGDVNGNKIVNILDITYLINFVYKSGPAPLNWMMCGDVNRNGAINILDITYLINFVYKGGPAPVGCPS